MKDKFERRTKAAEEHLNNSENSDTGGGRMFVATMRLKADTQDSEWIIDSGASRHMTFQYNILSEYKKFDNPDQFNLVMNTLSVLLELEKSR